MNAFLRILRLLPDVLEIIFIHSARNYHGTNHRPPFRLPSWANVSYVCHYWHNVALNCPALWSYHFAASLR